MEARVSNDRLSETEPEAEPRTETAAEPRTDTAAEPRTEAEAKRVDEALSASGAAALTERADMSRGHWFRACGIIALASIVAGLCLKGVSHPQFGGWTLGFHELGDLWSQAPGRTVAELAIRLTTQFGALAALLAILGLTITAHHERPGHSTRMLLAIPAAFLVWLGIVAMQEAATGPVLIGGAIAALVWLVVAAVECIRSSGRRRLGWLLVFVTLGAVADFVATRFPTSHDSGAWIRLVSIIGLAAQTQAIALAGHWWATAHRPGLRAATLGALATLGAVATALLVRIAAAQGTGSAWALRLFRDSAESTPDVMLKPWAALLAIWGILLAASLLSTRAGRSAIPTTAVALVVMAQSQLGRPICVLYLAVGAIALGLDAGGVTRQGVRHSNARV